MNYTGCTFQIPRGETARYVYVFVNRGTYYDVTKKVKLSGPYINISTVKIPVWQILTYINTVVALTY